MTPYVVVFETISGYGRAVVVFVITPVSRFSAFVTDGGREDPNGFDVDAWETEANL